MSSRNEILDRIRRNQPQPAELPALTGEFICYADRERQLADALASVGGRLVVVENEAAADAELQRLVAWQTAVRKCSAVPGVGHSTFDLELVTDPHTLHDVDFAVVRGEFAVAENAAIWVRGDAVRHRAIYFITQHLAIVVPRSEIVDEMHAAYSRLTLGERGFGVFISGPSKTADIEQSLVIGAHGARSLVVFLVGPAKG